MCDDGYADDGLAHNGEKAHVSFDLMEFTSFERTWLYCFFLESLSPTTLSTCSMIVLRGVPGPKLPVIPCFSNNGLSSSGMIPPPTNRISPPPFSRMSFATFGKAVM